MIRNNPTAFVALLEAYKANFTGNDVNILGTTYTTTEGTAAVDEAITFINAQSPIAPLIRTPGMDLACLDHVNDQSHTGATGHYGIDNSDPFTRLNRYG